MHRFFAKPTGFDGENVRIYEDANHIKRVLRLAAGDEIVVLDGLGYEYPAVIAGFEKDCCVVKVTDKRRALTEPELKVTLYQSIPKLDKMDGIIQKAVELGIYRIVPVITNRTVAKPDATSGKTERWRKIAAEAVKQCGRGVVPEVSAAVSFEQALAQMKDKDLCVMPYEVLGHGGESNLKEVLKNAAKCPSIGILIGPEGGFEPAEAEAAQAAGAAVVGLGRRILRTETAGAAVLAIIMYEAGEM